MPTRFHDPSHAADVTITLSSGVLRAAIETAAMSEHESQGIVRAIEPEIARAGKRGSFRALVLDMSRVRVMMSIGLGAVINLRNSAAEAGAMTFLVGMSRELTDLFRVMRIDRLCTIVFDEAELKKVLEGRG